ncbi:MAG TPA: hypothetical protein VN972_05305 [Methylomirabilota bacterium]|nr:hypothetical protein [Methylomirabilota bacterium]
MRLRTWILALALVAAAAHAATPAGAVPAEPAKASARSAPADASALYDAGTSALARGDLGPAVAFLAAAHRIDPRARDIRTNLAIARERVLEAEGAGGRGSAPVPSSLALSPAESWGASAALAALGALLLWSAAFRPRSRPFLLVGIAAFAAGSLLWIILMLRAGEERRHPQAVVVAPVLSVAPAPEERPLSPYLLGAGEEVRLGRARGDLVEIRVGGNSIGWAARSGLWRVADAARYTANSGVAR